MLVVVRLESTQHHGLDEDFTPQIGQGGRDNAFLSSITVAACTRHVQQFQQFHSQFSFTVIGAAVEHRSVMWLCSTMT